MEASGWGGLNGGGQRSRLFRLATGCAPALHVAPGSTRPWAVDWLGESGDLDTAQWADWLAKG